MESKQSSFLFALGTCKCFWQILDLEYTLSWWAAWQGDQVNESCKAANTNQAQSFQGLETKNQLRFKTTYLKKYFIDSGSINGFLPRLNPQHHIKAKSIKDSLSFQSKLNVKLYKRQQTDIASFCFISHNGCTQTTNIQSRQSGRIHERMVL